MARRLRAVNITVWFGAAVIYLFGIERLIDPRPLEWKVAAINLLTAPILLAVPLLHRFSPLAAPLFLVLIAYAFIFAINFIIGTGAGTYLYFFTATALGILFIGPKYVWLTVTASLVAVGLIIVLSVTVPHDTGIISPGLLFGFFVTNVIASSTILYGIVFYTMRQFAHAEEVLEERTHQLELANLAKSRFLAAASHDLRQPLHALGLFVAQLRGHMKSGEGARLAERIDAAMTTMNELFNALLDISKLDAGVLSTNVTEFPIAQVLKRIESTFMEAAREKGLSFQLVLSSVWVRSDPILLERIVLNLVSNAVRYTASGAIVVGCRRRGDTVHIEVWDSGPGVPEDQRRDIFGEFYRLAGENTHGGLGLGLAIVDRLCRLLGHSIQLDSTVGKGSRFFVTVPMAAAQAQIAEPQPAQVAIDATRGKLVMVIDDDALVLDSMGGLLRSWGCRVTAAATPDEALADLGSGEWPDLIICDDRLANGQSGIAAIADLRKACKAPVPAFLMSGDTSPERLREARESGHHLLHKPLSAMALRAMINRLLKRPPPSQGAGQI